MLRNRWILHSAAACLFIAALASGCASSQAGNPATPLAGRTVPVRIVNESHEIVDVYFVNDSGERIRIGMVAPLTTRSFQPRGLGSRSGYFVAHRKGYRDNGIRLDGVADPQTLGAGTVLVTIGASPEFDWWAIRS